MDDVVPNLKPQLTLWQLVGTLIAIASALGGIFWWAGRQTDPAKVERIQEQLTNVRLDQETQRGHLQAVEGSVQRIENAQNNLSVKIDQLLSRRRQ